jgi:phosphonate transport system permease protein
MSAALHPAERDPAAWGRRGLAAAALLVLWPLLRAAEFKPWLLWDETALRVTGRFLASFWPPAHTGEFLQLALVETWHTVAMATVGMVLGLVIALPLTLASTRVLSISALTGRMAAGPFVVRQLLRVLQMLLRSVPELVWALVFVRVVGLGPAAGVLAIALTFGGMLGKVYGEILESGENHAGQSLLRNGASRLQTLFYGLLPQHATELISYTVYRWECAIRSSVVLGFVGAGGLGQLMDGAAKMFNGGEVLSLLLIFMALVAAADRLSVVLRRGASRSLPWVLAGIAGLVIASFAGLDMKWAQFAGAEAWTAMGRFVAEFAPPETAPAFLAKTAEGLWETFAMSALGTLFAAFGGLVLALVASRPGWARPPMRWGLNALRSVPELVWASLLLISAGLGPFAGTLALAFHTSGVLGRLFVEALENAPPGPADALRAQGAGAMAVFFYATLPQVLPQLMSYTLYRWENNIRAAAVLGVVGAGGLGQALSYHLGLFQMHQAATVLVAMLILVAAVDALSYAARQALTR